MPPHLSIMYINGLYVLRHITEKGEVLTYESEKLSDILTHPVIKTLIKQKELKADSEKEF